MLYNFYSLLFTYLFLHCLIINYVVGSTLSSGLNSLAAVTWEDFLVRIPAMKRLSPKGQVNTIRFTGD